jgi:hypothetical protein
LIRPTEAGKKVLYLIQDPEKKFASRGMKYDEGIIDRTRHNFKLKCVAGPEPQRSHHILVEPELERETAPAPMAPKHVLNRDIRYMK